VFDYPTGTEGHALHFGEPFPQDGVWYQARGGTLRSGLLAVEFLLTDQPTGRGGFCASPARMGCGVGEAEQAYFAK
jgi:hypothetical protein